MPHIQNGTNGGDKLRAVAVRADNSILLAGWTAGTWTILGDIDGGADYAAVVFDPSVLSSPSTNATTSPMTSPCSSPFTMPTPAPTPAPTPGAKATQMPFSVPPTPTILTPSRTPQPNYVEHDSGTSSSRNTLVTIGCCTGAAAMLVILIVVVTKAGRRSRWDLCSGKSNSSSAGARQPHTFVPRVAGAVPPPPPYSAAAVMAARHSATVVPPVNGGIPPPPPYSQAVGPRS